MKNFRLIRKLMLLTAILLAIALVQSWTGITRLASLNSMVRQLGGPSLEKVVSAGDLRLRLLAAIRAQKNAVMTVSDRESEMYAAESQKQLSETKSALRTLESLAVEDEQDLVDDATESLEEFRKRNNECLELAVQNTNLKAATELYGRIHESTRMVVSLLDSIESRRQNQSAKPADDTSPTGTSSVRQLSALIQEIVRTAAEHISTSAADSNFPELDSRLRAMLEQLPGLAIHVETGCS